MEGYFTLKILFTTGINVVFVVFFPRATVLLGGSLAKKLNELYSLIK